MAGPSVNAMGNGRLWVFSGVGFGSVSDDMTSIPYDVLSVAVYNIICLSSYCIVSPAEQRTRSVACRFVFLLLAGFWVLPKNGARLYGRLRRAKRLRKKNPLRRYTSVSAQPRPKEKQSKAPPHITMTTTDQRRSRRP